MATTAKKRAKPSEARGMTCPACGADDGYWHQWQEGSFSWPCRVDAGGDWETTSRAPDFGDDVSGVLYWECGSCHATFDGGELGVGD